MHQLDHEALNKFTTYVEEVMRDCARQSEQSVLMVSRILDIITSDIDRISKMSSEAVRTLEEAKVMAQLESQRISGRNEQETTNSSPIMENRSAAVQKLSQVLLSLAKNDNEAKSLIMQMIEALQFQDRVRQQMENTIKMFPIWQKFRQRTTDGELKHLESEDALVEFGQELFKVTTTNEERDAICAFISKLEKPSDVSSDDDFFF